MKMYQNHNLYKETCLNIVGIFINNNTEQKWPQLCKQQFQNAKSRKNKEQLMISKNVKIY